MKKLLLQQNEKKAYKNFIDKRYKDTKGIPSIDDRIDEKKVRIKIFGQFAKEREKLGKKNDFSLEEIEKKKREKFNHLLGQNLAFEKMIKIRKEKLKTEELSEKERKKIEDEITAYNSNLQVIRNYMKELEILSSQNKINFANFINSLSDRLIPEYKEFKVKRKKIIVESIFQNIIIDEKGLHIYCQPYYVMFFKERIKDTLILSTEIPKKITKKKKK